MHPLDGLESYSPATNNIDALLHEKLLDEDEMNEENISIVKIDKMYAN